jgi:hypothetical protein
MRGQGARASHSAPRRRRDRRRPTVTVLAAVVAAATLAGGIWFVLGDADGSASDQADGVRIADLGVGGPLLTPHFSNGRLYADGGEVPYNGAEGELVEATDGIVLRTLDGRVVLIDDAGKATSIGDNAAALPVVSTVGRYAAWPVRPEVDRPSHTGVVVWDLQAGRVVGTPAFPFSRAAGDGQLAIDRFGRTYAVSPDQQLWVWDRLRKAFQLHPVPDAPKVDTVGGGGEGVIVRTGDSWRRTSDPDEFVPGLEIAGTEVAWNDGATVAWFDDAGLHLQTGTSETELTGGEVAWPVDAEPGEIVWESDGSFVVLPGGADQPVIRCYAANAGCRVVAAD